MPCGTPIAVLYSSECSFIPNYQKKYNSCQVWNKIDFYWSSCMMQQQCSSISVLVPTIASDSNANVAHVPEITIAKLFDCLTRAQCKQWTPNAIYMDNMPVPVIQNVNQVCLWLLRTIPWSSTNHYTARSLLSKYNFVPLVDMMALGVGQTVVMSICHKHPHQLPHNV